MGLAAVAVSAWDERAAGPFGGSTPQGHVTLLLIHPDLTLGKDFFAVETTLANSPMPSS